jgi:DNA-binding NtrC family response regulator
MVMPEGMSGTDVAAQLRKRKPELKVVFTSGYSPEVVGKDLSQSDITFLAKPYLPQQLAQVVRQCLDQTQKQQPTLIPG